MPRWTQITFLLPNMSSCRRMLQLTLAAFEESDGSTVGTQGWSEMSLTLNTDTDTITFGVRVYDDLLGLNSSTTGIVASRSLGIDSAALTDLRWDLRGGALNNSAVSFKNYFDDFSFNVAPVPEPGSALSVGLSTLLLLRRRRKSVTA